MSRPFVVALLLAIPAAGAPLPGAEPGSNAARIVGAALVSGQAFATAQALADGIGPRLAGSPGAERAVEWGLAELARAGLKNIRREPVKLRTWSRGEARVEVVSPATQALAAVALGNSVGTPAEGVTAEIIEVATLEALAALGERVRGRIVLFNQRMERSARSFEEYGRVVAARGMGSLAAARLGAVGALIRSVGTGDFRMPHTGATRYDEKAANIPFAAIAAEDADLLHRLLAAGRPVKVKLALGCRHGDEIESANVVGELPGRDKAGEIVLLGAHLDSWDLGTGASDDAAGCAMVIEAARLLVQLKLPPRRTVRVVLFMNEERGLSGALAYAERHAAEISRHVAAFEADSGAGRPFGFVVSGSDASATLLGRLAAPLAALRANEVRLSPEAGADLLPLQKQGVPVLGLWQDLTHYFDWHHTAGDTLDKIDPIDLALGAAATAVIADGLANSEQRLPAPPLPRFDLPVAQPAPSVAPTTK